jgi:ADP-ribosyl-[dinitrogen reductase] hydrolase
MKKSLSLIDRVSGALFGMFIGDALAMPVHWYYDTKALAADYGRVTDYLQPRNPHPDSILWRSSYSPPKRSCDILHNQRQYWGRRDIHYHQFLHAGENTLNLQLARELLLLLERDGKYSADSWLEALLAFMTVPDRHNDTYVEEYLRHFFDNLGNGKEPSLCGRRDEKHIGGFTLMLPLTVALLQSPSRAVEISLQHLALTHGGPVMRKWGVLLATILLALLHGESLRQAFTAGKEASRGDIAPEILESLAPYPDTTVVGRHFSSACYVDHAVPVSLYLALKYRDAPEQGLIANTMCGGDNAGRGAVLGALLGALHGLGAWPSRWVDGLLRPPPIVCFAPEQGLGNVQILPDTEKPYAI